MDGPNALSVRLDLLHEGLIAAAAADLRVMTRRRLLPVSEVACFIDGYQRVEESEHPRFLVDFAQRISEEGARVLLVIVCRVQDQWTAYAKEQHDHLDYGSHLVSRRIQIHRLEPLGWSDRVYALEKYGVPAVTVRQYKLTYLSAGMPLALLLLGYAFGDFKASGSRARALCAQLPDPDAGTGDGWFEQFSTTVALHTIDDLGKDLELHLRAAASQRNFDAALLSRLLDGDFSDACYEQLVASLFVGTPRPSSLLETDESFRVRSFARAILAEDQRERTALQRWHARAAEHFDELADVAGASPRAFELRAEALYHRLFIEPDDAKPELFARFNNELHDGRTDRCEALLRVALDYNRVDPHWRAMVLASAGKMYLARNHDHLAEERLREAKELVSFDDDLPLAVAVTLALTKALRVQDRLDEARDEFSLLKGLPNLHPIVEFQCTWTDSVIAKSHGHLNAAMDLAREAKDRLGPLIEESDAKESIRVAESYGLGSLPRKAVHLTRHEADLARCSGDYVRCFEKLEKARAGYREDPEAGVEGYTDLIAAHVLRHEGDSEGSLELAESVYEKFVGARPVDHRGAGRATRCMAQALLCGEEPQRARALLERLIEIDPEIYPGARPFGEFGLGELARIDGDLDEARSRYRESEKGTGRQRAHFERCYPLLGRIEIERIEAPHRVDGQLRRVLDQPGVADFPTLLFAVELLRMRAFPGEYRHAEAAERLLQRFNCRSGTGTWEHETLRRTRDAMKAGSNLPALVLNLP